MADVSVFKRERVHPMAIKCKRGHALVRYDVAPCDGHKQHLVYVCPMRLGSKRCGDVVVLPPFGPGCNEPEE